MIIAMNREGHPETVAEALHALGEATAMASDRLATVASDPSLSSESNQSRIDQLNAEIISALRSAVKDIGDAISRYQRSNMRRVTIRRADEQGIDIGDE